MSLAHSLRQENLKKIILLVNIVSMVSVIKWSYEVPYSISIPGNTLQRSEAVSTKPAHHEYY